MRLHLLEKSEQLIDPERFGEDPRSYPIEKVTAAHRDRAAGCEHEPLQERWGDAFQRFVDMNAVHPWHLEVAQDGVDPRSCSSTAIASAPPLAVSTSNEASASSLAKSRRIIGSSSTKSKRACDGAGEIGRDASSGTGVR